MRNFDETNITDAVLEKVRQGADGRVRQVSEALVRHLHAFVREIEPTQAEWASAIEFLTRTGHMCTDTRQEFILLSDVSRSAISTVCVASKGMVMSVRHSRDTTGSLVSGPKSASLTLCGNCRVNVSGCIAASVPRSTEA